MAPSQAECPKISVTTTALPGRYNANIRQEADGKRYVMIFFEQNMAEIHFLFVILQFVPYLHIHIWEIDYQQHIDTASSSEARQKTSK